MYHIIYHDYSRGGIVFYNDGCNGMAKSSLEDGAVEYENERDAKDEVERLIAGGVPANRISIVKIIPFEIEVY